ncbi:protein phosphatase 2A regulatory B subunit family protein [Striga asiatica]|uniref:Protein phosphatase 2A regulatory B subunit family protein n=1 Tax=Striga asiatica TaxID=4170 RepID=A0A5A7RE14_STRAF|nr:protein phosphatase 2A regulatory B subunit family protein [Striga asiatica]
MSKDDTNSCNSSQEHVKREEKEEEENNSVALNSEIEDNTDDGYKTPTSEEHKIPAVVLSCPPPAPKRRKRLVLRKPADLQKQLDRGVDDEKTIVIREADLDYLLKTLAGESRVPSTGSGKECVLLPSLYA